MADDLKSVRACGRLKAGRPHALLWRYVSRSVGSLGQGPLLHVVAPALQHSPLQVALPSVDLQSAALALMIQKLLAPLSTAARANGNTALSSILLIKLIALLPSSCAGPS